MGTPVAGRRSPTFFPRLTAEFDSDLDRELSVRIQPLLMPRGEIYGAILIMAVREGPEPSG